MKAILLIPSPGDPHGLLARGKCGTRPPTLHACNGNTRTYGVWMIIYDGFHDCERCVEALVLARDGEPVAEGCDRAARRLLAVGSGDYRPELAASYSLDGALTLAHEGASWLGGEVVVIEESK